ncbi:hypothetical protein GBA65_21760 (plasmid) [Rubrobacter marinus]|uniref:Uncharacterized protein n=1 Tax=Rubrobacter marinus TaxID=2653852 RepID=A0A6G8Q426_9ACTN|nr:hypothetical protein [Rubrobacter marinus]QIN81067.1 hypothetical protein GBA65_21760 [Rubrobacter marinus]
MHLAADVVLPYRGPNGSRSKCRVRIYEPDDSARDAPVVILSRLADNPGASVTNAAPLVAAEVISLFALTRWGGPSPVFVEHYDRGGRDAREDRDEFALVAFSHHEVRAQKRAGVSYGTLGEPSLSHLDRAAVESLVGHRV